MGLALDEIYGVHMFKLIAANQFMLMHLELVDLTQLFAPSVTNVSNQNRRPCAQRIACQRMWRPLQAKRPNTKKGPSLLGFWTSLQCNIRIDDHADGPVEAGSTQGSKREFCKA